ncbi:MAG: F0F1 ATP synthase subunit gamma [Clostridiaceae bacterium]|jgi:F-type H+-transporting ATPase subunit gamma|nr:F0F1 ATP synthase subunit gamma [Clostridiaceae bacterium]
MAQISEIKGRIRSIKDTKQITKAMKLISAAKLKRARRQLDHALPYFEKVRSTMVDILMRSGDIKNKFFDLRDEKEGKKKAYLVLTGDKGLAGGYNHNVIKKVEEHFEGDKNALLFVAGNVGKYHFSKNKYNVYMEFEYPVQNPTVYRARDISELILKLFAEGVFDEMYLAFTYMQSTVSIEPQVIKLLPLELDALKEDMKITENIEGKIENTIVYDPSPQEVLDILVGKYVKGVIYGAFVEAFTSEQSARMTAMDSATANADDMLAALSLSYNRARQAKITQELSEIVGGAEAMK